MKRNKITTIVLMALSLLNYLVGGLMGFILIRDENIKTFTFVFLIFIAVSALCLVADWFTIQQANAGTEYRVLKLKKWHLVREQRRMKPDEDGLHALAMGITGFTFSLTVPLFAFALIWPDTFWLPSFSTILSVVAMVTVLTEFIIGFVISYRKEKKGETI